MTRIKICGITNLEDALFAVRCGADALGFVLVEGTPRYIDEDTALEIVPKLPPFVNRVAVVRKLRFMQPHHFGQFDTIQYYVDADGRARPGKRLIRAVRLRDEGSLLEVAEAELSADAVLIDAYHPEKLGGSGIRADWQLSAEAVRRLKKPAILAGGLTPESVAGALAEVRPYAVDVSSGVESEPGRKDPAKVLRFIEAVREFDQDSGH